MELGLKDRHVFIAGASQGIGEGIARAFLAQGAKVSLTARGAEKLEAKRAELAAEHGADRIWAGAGDMTDSAVLVRTLDAAEAALGPAHVAIANVGLDDAPAGFDMPDEKWESGIRQNFLSGARLAREWLRRTVARPAGERAGANLILISSIAGLEALGTPLTYGPMKAATNALGKELARHAGRENIRVNVVAPGNIIFPGGDWEARVNARPDPWNKWIRREVALRRFGTPAEIADACLYVASARATFLTGAVIPVDGGQVK